MSSRVSNYQWHRDRSLFSLLLVSFFMGYSLVVNSVSASYLAVEFSLSETALSAMFGWLATGLLGTLFLSRLGDLFGRRTLLLTSLAILWTTSTLTVFIPNFIGFLLLQMLGMSAIGTALAVGPVMITEFVPTDARTQVQALAVILVGTGSGTALLTTIVYAQTPLTWRYHWIFLAAAIPLVIVYSWFALRETERYLALDDELGRAAWSGILAVPHTLPLAAAMFLGIVATRAATTYEYYYLISIRGMSQASVSTTLLAGGMIGIAGTFIGARACDRYGRVICTITSGIILASSLIGLYTVSGVGAELTLAVFTAYTVGITAASSREVGIRTLATELYPTHLRSTYAGLLATIIAMGAVVSNFLTTLLIEVTGSLAMAVRLVLCLTIPAILCFLFVPETRGRQLDEAIPVTDNGRLIDAIRR